MVINTNKSAVDAASSLKSNNTALSRSLARLSSGTKIVNPSDDAAGLAVSEKLTAQSSRIKAAQVNNQNAVSLIQTADGFLESMGKVLNRMSELSILAQDATKNTNDIELYGLEFNELKQQLRDVIGNTDNGTDSAPNWNISGSEPSGMYNGTVLFGSRDPLSFVVGASGDQTMSLDETNLRAIGGALSDLMWDNSVDGSQPDIDISSSAATALIGSALEQVAEERADLGASQSRIQVIDAQLRVQFENLEAANSRIRDVDIAEETTRMAKFDILVKSGTSMLAQANALPQTVLRVLN